MCKLGRILWCSIAMVVVGCSGKPDTEADRAAIARQLDEIAQTVKTAEGVQTRLLGHFADDAVLMPASGAFITGREQIGQFYARAFRTLKSMELAYDAPVIVIDGDLAVRRYRADALIHFREEREPAKSSTNYIDVLRRQPDRSWKIVWHAWSPAGQRGPN